jgi:hypothetical protein
LVYIFVDQTNPSQAMENNQQEPDLYKFTVALDRRIEQLLKKEQAKRVFDGQKKTALPRIATELLTKALNALPE